MNASTSRFQLSKVPKAISCGLKFPRGAYYYSELRITVVSFGIFENFLFVGITQAEWVATRMDAETGVFIGNMLDFDFCKRACFVRTMTVPECFDDSF